MTTSDTQVSNLIINRLTKAQYEAIQSPSPNEIYLITDEVIAGSDIVNALGYTPQAELVSGTNIKTINGNSLLGSGDITISGGGGTWGSITGTLSNQTDLQNALNDKLNLTGGTMSGPITITGEYGTTEIGGGFISAHSATAGSWEYVFADDMINLQFGSTSMNFNGTSITIDADEDVYIDANYLSIPTSSSNYTNIGNEEAISAGWLKTNAMPLKQDTLISGTNIKTINNQSLLGSGNIDVSGGGGTWGSIAGTLSDQTDLQDALDLKLNISDVQEYTASEIETLWGSI